MNQLFFVASQNPSLVEGGVLHAFAAGDEVAIDAVDRAVGALNDGGVMKRSGGLVFQVPRLRPRAPLIAR